MDMTQESTKKTLNYALAGIAAIVVFGLIAWGSSAFQAFRAAKKAEAQLQKGFATLAADTIDPYRYKLATREPSCKTMIVAYYQARRVDRLEWAAQACLDNGREFPEAYIGLAAVREMTGRDAEAVQVLLSATPKFEKTPQIYYSLAQILRRLKKDKEAMAAFDKAIAIAPDNNQLALDALTYYSSLQKWQDAKKLAERLKTVQTDNPEVKLVVARALANAGEKEAAQPLIEKAKEIMAKNPQLKDILEKAYGDVLGAQHAKK